MVDLETQYGKIKTEIDTAIAAVIQSMVFIKGPEVARLEKQLAEYLQVKHVIACANGTDALQIAMMALDLKPGEEVITACFTYAATAEVIALLKLKPVLVDVDPDTFNLDIEAVEKAITPKTKAIVPVHLFGQCADMEPLLALAAKHQLHIIEDAAQAIGAEYVFGDGSNKKAGTMGNIGTLSFFPSKNLGCFGDGGAILVNDDALAAKIRRIANHGQSSLYLHDEVGVNSRLDAIQAAILLVKLPHLNSYNQARQKAADYYDAQFKNHPNIKIPVRAAHRSHTFHQYTLQLKGIDRDSLKAYLKQLEIPTTVYYPMPLNTQKAYLQEGDFTVTQKLSDTVLSLPMHSELELEQLEYITQHILKFLKDQTLIPSI